MAADSQVTWDEAIVGANQGKIQRVRDALVGCAGRVDDIVLFLEWFEAGENPEERPELDDTFTALVLREDGIYAYADKCVAIPPDNEVAAIGGGADFALGALYAGAPVEEAVRVACELHTGSGPPVVVEKL